MVEKTVIEKSFSIAIVKCSPKSRALDYYNKHKDNFHEDVGGELWIKQEELQSGVTYTDEEIHTCADYSGMGYDLLNSKLYDTDRWHEILKNSEKFKQEYGHPLVDINYLNGMMGFLDSAIDKSPQLSQDTILFRTGHWDNLKVGEHGKWKGYTSTSYSKNVAYEFIEGSDGLSKNRYMIKIYAPKGTNGILQTDQFNPTDELEFTLGRNQKYVVLDVDDEQKTAEILLY